MNSEIQTAQHLVDTAGEFIVNYGFQMLGAVIILAVGWYVSKWSAKSIMSVCQRASLDVTLSKFLAGVTKTLVLIVVLIMALGKFGVTIAPFIAALGAVAFGGTLAFQGPLSNYGAGLTIVLTRPFVVGDTIKVQGVTGIVEDIKLAYTLVSTEDGEMITIPNKHIVGEVIRNSFANLVVEAVVGISYDSDIRRAIELIEKVLTETDGVSRDPLPQVGIRGFGDSAVEIAYRYWVPTKRYYPVQFAVNERIYSGFMDNGIAIPYPRRDVHMLGEG